MIEQNGANPISDTNNKFKEVFGSKTTNSVEIGSEKTENSDEQSQTKYEVDNRQRDFDRKIKAQGTLIWKAASRLARTVESEDDIDGIYSEDPSLADKVVEAKYKDRYGIKSYEDYKKFRKMVRAELGEEEESPKLGTVVESELHELKQWKEQQEDEKRKLVEEQNRQQYEQSKNKFLEKYPEYRDEDKFKELEERARSISVSEILEAAHLQLGGEMRRSSYGREDIANISSGISAEEYKTPLTPAEKRFFKGLGVKPPA